MKRFKLKRSHETFEAETETGVCKIRIYEMNGTQREQYMDEVRKRMEVDEEGKPKGLKSAIGLQSALLGLCLVRVLDDGGVEKEQPVLPSEIDTWPGVVVQDLFVVAQRLNGLGVAEKEKTTELKNG